MAPGEQAPGRHDPSQVTTALLPVGAATRPARVGVEFGALTHVGKVRPNNEDQYLIARLRKSLEVLASSLPDDAGARPASREGYLMLVADGMGGRGGGEVASARVVEAAKDHVLNTAKWFFHLDDPDEEVRLRNLRESLRRIDRELVEEARADPALAGMGTTLTAASSVGEEVLLVHVGDSRAYLFRRGVLDQLTRDHTFAQQLVEAGLVEPEEARSHRLRHVLTNVVGGEPGVRGEIARLRVADGDRLLLCTDGLTEMVEDARIAELLARHPAPEDACRALVAAALDGGGRDNVTVVVAAYSVSEA
jgi:protein phosphatase